MSSDEAPKKKPRKHTHSAAGGDNPQRGPGASGFQRRGGDAERRDKREELERQRREREGE